MNVRQKQIRESVKLGTVVSFKTGKLDSNAATLNGKYPFFTCSQETFRTDTYSFDTECVLLAGNNANGIYPLKFFSGKFDAYQRTYVIRSKDANRLNNRFLYYALRLKLDHLRSISTGAATKFLTLTILNDIDLELPLTEEQQGIASILSAYDDLIENNTRRIQILEQMAQRVYHEWFVRFRFPGHGTVKMVESELGLIPEGWEAKRLGDIANIQWGDTTKTKKEYADIGYDAFSASGLDGKLPTYDFDHNGIVLSAIGARCGLTWFARGKWSCIKNTMRYWSLDSEISNEYLFWATYGQGFWTRRGAAQPFISLGDSRNALILKPATHLLESYESIAIPAMSQTHLLEKENLNLRTTRDLLLPKLISGEIDVSTFPGL